jgi:hypothetical protein
LAVFPAALRSVKTPTKKGMLPMPVLDAKALEIDPKGMAFLLSVLRPSPSASSPQPKEVTPPKSLPHNVRVHFRFSRRMKLLLPTFV